ncbi:MAG: DUF1450 domain-containing protein [Paenibacillaceae bacterium]|uniref:DUF1450 domain-containing protein n=1 Tax=Paenibacillus cymbidii TaxID=1639034 RepID=UPI001080E00B|nr:DUF1450 domain-containing protein [Paenibacillus cymbidii]MBO9604372.1 DUF1450 domain-containing protein [Paenibacillaceae bacterium]
MAKNDIRVCDKCKHTRLKTIVPRLEKLAPDADIKVGCKSYCGPCSRFAFVFINGRYITGATEDEAVDKASKYIKR